MSCRLKWKKWEKLNVQSSNSCRLPDLLKVTWASYRDLELRPGFWSLLGTCRGELSRFINLPLTPRVQITRPASLCIWQMNCEIRTMSIEALWTLVEKSSWWLRTSKRLLILKSSWSALSLAAGRSLRTLVIGKGLSPTTIWPTPPRTWFSTA